MVFNTPVASLNSTLPLHAALPISAWHPGWAEQSYRFAAKRGYSVVLTGFFAELLTDLTRGLVPHLVATGRVRPALRSEEHTSELQSPYDIVCSLLLEKKQNKKT